MEFIVLYMKYQISNKINSNLFFILSIDIDSEKMDLVLSACKSSHFSELKVSDFYN